MAKLRIQGDTSGYVDLEAPTNASSSTLDLDQVPQLNQNTTFSKDSPEFTIQGTTAQAHLRLESVANTSAWMISNESNVDRMRIMHTNTSTSANIFPMYIYEAGYVTKPNQPYVFYERADTSAQSGSNVIPRFVDLRNSRGTNGYNTSTGLYTAPVAGVYNCCWVYLYQTIDNAAKIDDGFVINGSYYYGGNRYTVSPGYGWGDGYVAVKGSVNVYLNQNDTFAPRTAVSGDTSWSFYGGYNWGWITIALIG